MRGKSKIFRYSSLRRIVTKLRDDFQSGDRDFILLFAYNGIFLQKLYAVTGSGWDFEMR